MCIPFGHYTDIDFDPFASSSARNFPASIFIMCILVRLFAFIRFFSRSFFLSLSHADNIEIH